MLTLTDSAAQLLCSLLEGPETPVDMATRIAHEERGFLLVFDRARAEDATLKHKGRTVIVLDQQVCELLSNDTLDVKSTKSELRFFFSQRRICEQPPYLN